MKTKKLLHPLNLANPALGKSHPSKNRRVKRGAGRQAKDLRYHYSDFYIIYKPIQPSWWFRFWNWKQLLPFSLAFLAACVSFMLFLIWKANRVGAVYLSSSSGYSLVAYQQPLQTYALGERTEEVTIPDFLTYICDPKFSWNCARAKRVAFCESSYRETVVGPTKDVGLFQIAPVHGYTREYLSNYKNNTDVAYKLWLARGWQPWNASKHCWSK